MYIYINIYIYIYICIYIYVMYICTYIIYIYIYIQNLSISMHISYIYIYVYLYLSVSVYLAIYLGARSPWFPPMVCFCQMPRSYAKVINQIELWRSTGHPTATIELSHVSSDDLHLLVVSGKDHRKYFLLVCFQIR